jgi:hypothetical protein
MVIVPASILLDPQLSLNARLVWIACRLRAVSVHQLSGHLS